MRDIIFPEIVKRLKEFVFAKGKDFIGPFFETGCDEHVKIPDSYQVSTDTHLIVFLNFNDHKKGLMAVSAPCAVEPETNRPNIGLISINLKRIKIEQRYVEYYINSFIHEIFHIMAFSPVLYEFFPGYPTQIVEEIIGEKKTYKFKTERLVRTAVNHFACN